MEKLSIEDYALEHECDDDDEMLEIREITNNYTIPSDNLHLQVVIEELKAFDRELNNHAYIENEIFFPKAMALEAAVKEELKEHSRSN